MSDFPMFFTLQAAAFSCEKGGWWCPTRACHPNWAQGVSWQLSLASIFKRYTKAGTRNMLFLITHSIHGTIVLFTYMCHKKSTIRMQVNIRPRPMDANGLIFWINMAWSSADWSWLPSGDSWSLPHSDCSAICPGTQKGTKHRLDLENFSRCRSSYMGLLGTWISALGKNRCHIFGKVCSFPMLTNLPFSQHLNHWNIMFGDFTKQRL